MNDSALRTIDSNHVGIVASADENYAPHLTVMFTSLLKNCPSPDRLRLFCIDGGISPDTRDWMQKEVNRASGKDIDFVRIDRTKFDDLPTIKHITSSAYYRIAIPEIFDEQVKKIIYLDCDMVVRGNILDLWSIDIDGYHIGAVENLSGHTYKKLGIPQNEYFNSGMLLINVDLWRRDNIPEKILAFKRDNSHRISTNDQCAMNGVLHKTWKHLPPTWNHQTGLYRSNDQTRTFNEQDVNNAIIDPKIIHYISWDKPWRKVRFHPLAGEYDRYADQLTRTLRSQPTTKDYLSAYSSASRIKKLIRRKRWHRWYKKQGFSLYKTKP